MSKITALNLVLKRANKLSDRKLAREIRIDTMRSMLKTAESEGMLEYFHGGPAEFKSREQHTAERGAKNSNEGLYGVGLPDHKNTDLTETKFDRSLSTRYSPDRVGVQAKRVSDGVYQDPITNKIYDWNEGFKTEDGETFNGGGVALQTDILYRS